MKKTNKPNPLKFFNDNKAMAYKKAGGEMAKYKVALKKAQDGITVKESDLAKQYTNAPMVGAEPFSEYAEKQRIAAGKVIPGVMGPSPNAYKESKNVVNNNWYNDPRFSKNVEGVDAFYKKEVDAGTIYGKKHKGFMSRYNQASKDYLKANPKLNQIETGKKKGGSVGRKKK